MLKSLPKHVRSLHESMVQQPAYDGMPAQLISLTNAQGMVVTLMDIGATWLSCCVPVDQSTELREVVLGVTTMKDFEQGGSYLGVTVGRYANRIKAGQFSIDGNDYQVSVNQAGNCLHGGEDGFNLRRWQMKQLDAARVEFTLLSADGDMGFPGNVTTVVTYTLTNDNAVQIDYSAQTDKPCPVNLTNHAYFNLLGSESGTDCLGHTLSVMADHYLPTDKTGIPRDGLKAVTGTSFDFRQPKTIQQDFLSDEDQVNAAGYDHSFAINTDHRDGNQICAMVVAPDASLMMEVTTTKPAIQLYTGNYLAGCPNRSGGEYKNHSGLALETQFLPDAPNHPEWIDNPCILKPGERYSHMTRYKFI